MTSIGLLMFFVLFLFSLVVFHKGRHRYSNVLLGLYLISQMIGIGNFLLFVNSKLLLPKWIHFYMIGFPMVFLWLPLFFLFLQSLFNPLFRLKLIHALHFIPSALVAVYLIMYFYFEPVDVKILKVNAGTTLGNWSVFLDTVFSLQIAGYNAAAFVRYFHFRRSYFSHYSTNDYVTIFWMRLTLFGFMAASSVVLFSKFAGEFGVDLPWPWVNFFTFLLFYSVLFYVAIVHQGIIITDLSAFKDKYSYSKIDNKELEQYLGKIERCITEKELFKVAELTLSDLAKISSVNERIVSQAINSLRKQNFSEFINAYRIDYARQLLTDQLNADRKMFDILLESGFNSKTTFNTVFKKSTGLTPSQFRKKQIS